MDRTAAAGRQQHHGAAPTSWRVRTRIYPGGVYVSAQGVGKARWYSVIQRCSTAQKYSTYLEESVHGRRTVDSDPDAPGHTQGQADRRGQ